MSVNKYNAEGYYDPTAYEALSLIEKAAKKHRPFRPIVYVCSPLAGDIKGNQARARIYCKFAVDSGRIPVAPHIYFTQFMDDNNPSERDLAIFMGIVFLTKCSEVWVFGERISIGMKMEIQKARNKGIPIRFFSEDCKEVTPK